MADLEKASYVDSECAYAKGARVYHSLCKVGSPVSWNVADDGSMNGEVRIWDSRAGGDTPLYESTAQPQGLMGLAVHNSTPVFAT
jgi:hypothetical protein